MALPASGTISLSQVNVELALASTTAISMNQATVRTLFGVPSGAISMSNGYGKSSVPVFTTPALMNGSTGEARMYSVAVNSAGLFVAVGSKLSAPLYTPVYATSTNGSTWTTPALMNGSTAGASMYSVTVNSAGLFVAVGANSTNWPVYATSTNGSTWTTPALMNGSTYYASMTSVTVNSAGLFVAVGINPSSRPVYATSTNGSTWTTPALMSGSTDEARMTSVTVNSAGLFVAVGYKLSAPASAPVYATSTDGSTWTTPALMNGSTAAALMLSVAVNTGGRFVAVGINQPSSSPVYATSTDGSTWTTPALMNGSTAEARMASVTVNSAGLFVAVGNDSSFRGLYART